MSQKKQEEIKRLFVSQLQRENTLQDSTTRESSCNVTMRVNDEGVQQRHFQSNSINKTARKGLLESRGKHEGTDSETEWLFDRNSRKRNGSRILSDFSWELLLYSVIVLMLLAKSVGVWVFLFFFEKKSQLPTVTSDWNSRVAFLFKLRSSLIPNPLWSFFSSFKERESLLHVIRLKFLSVVFHIFRLLCCHQRLEERVTVSTKKEFVMRFKVRKRRGNSTAKMYFVSIVTVIHGIAFTCRLKSSLLKCSCNHHHKSQLRTWKRNIFEEELLNFLYHLLSLPFSSCLEGNSHIWRRKTKSPFAASLQQLLRRWEKAWEK